MLIAPTTGNLQTSLEGKQNYLQLKLFINQ